jgi:mannose-1-phosphate guanylyltransferase
LQDDVDAASVVNIAEEEYADEPDAHTLCTWNSYVVEDSNPVMVLGIAEEYIVVQTKDAVGLYLRL